MKKSISVFSLLLLVLSSVPSLSSAATSPFPFIPYKHDLPNIKSSNVSKIRVNVAGKGCEVTLLNYFEKTIDAQGHKQIESQKTYGTWNCSNPEGYKILNMFELAYMLKSPIVVNFNENPTEPKFFGSDNINLPDTILDVAFDRDAKLVYK